MSRKTDDLNQVWFIEEGKLINIGFTQSFLDSLDQCWHIMPSHNERFKKKSPLFTIETNEALLSIPSPIEGYFVSFNNKASNFPDKLVESDVVLTLQGEAVPKVAPQTVTVNLDGWANVQAVGAGGGGVGANVHWDGRMLDVRPVGDVLAAAPRAPAPRRPLPAAPADPLLNAARAARDEARRAGNNQRMREMDALVRQRERMAQNVVVDNEF